MTRSAFLRLLALSTVACSTFGALPAQADSVLIVHTTDSLGLDISSNLSNQLTAGSHSVTSLSSVPGSLAGYAQIWDVRYANTSPITSGEHTQYLGYLQGGGGMFIMGENTGFMTRNNSITSLITDAGGGTLTIVGALNSQTVLAAAQSPNVITTIGYQAPSGSVSTGNGQCLTRDSNNVCSAITWAPGQLTNTPLGSLTVVFDVNFMQTVPGGSNEAAFLQNLVHFVTQQASGSGFASMGATPYQRAVAGSFNTLFGNTSGELSSIMVNIAGMGSAAEQNHALEVAASSYPQIPLTTAFTGLRANLTDVARWISASPFAPAPVQTADAGAMKLASAFGNSAVMTDAADMNLARLASATSGVPSWTNGQGLSAFLNIGYTGGTTDATTNQSGYTYDGFIGTGGVAYALTKEFTVGGAVGINSLTSHIDDSRGNGTTNTYNLIAFGHFADGTGLYADATANAGYVDYSYDRNIVVGAFAGKAHGSSDGYQLGTSLGGGYDFNIDNGGKTGVMKNVTVGPFAQLQYQYANLGGFTESGAGTASLHVGGQSVHSLTMKVGGRLAGEVESPLGPFVPMVSVAYEREFLNGSRSVDTSFVGGTAAPFATPVDSAERNFAVIGVGLSKNVGDGFTAALSYGGRYNINDVQHSVTFRGKLDF